MMQLVPQMRILVCLEPVDFRAGIDGLCRWCRKELRADPFGGAVFVFRNRRGDALKLLSYDGQGFWLCHKRLSVGRYGYWPQRGQEKVAEMLAHELSVLVMGGDPSGTRAAPPWKALRPAPAWEGGGQGEDSDVCEQKS